jgi:hypothetical protein
MWDQPAFGALRSVFSNRHIDYRAKGRVFVALCLSLLLYGCEVWCLKEKQLCRLRSFHSQVGAGPAKAPIATAHLGEAGKHARGPCT